jgi:hypothetical protein
MSYKYVVSSHMNPNLSGVAKFNALLARRLSVPCVGLSESPALEKGPILLSVKFGDNGHVELEQARKVAESLAAGRVEFDIFFHTFDGLDVEYQLLETCRQVFCANNEIAHALEGSDKRLIEAWCPALVNSDGIVKETRLNLFSFGMAHKLQVRYYKKLHELLGMHDVDYAVWVSTAFHEKANFGDFNAVSRQLGEVFGDRIQFLGFLSDDAVNYFLKKTQVFVSFFAKGVRANNTSVSAAMSRGCVVMTNCDEHSPSWMKHGINILDVNKTAEADLAPARLKAIAQKASADAALHSSWGGLETLLRHNSNGSRRSASTSKRTSRL